MSTIRQNHTLTLLKPADQGDTGEAAGTHLAGRMRSTDEGGSSGAFRKAPLEEFSVWLRTHQVPGDPFDVDLILTWR